MKSAAQTYDRSYLERTIATVRNHRDADNCWPSWANIFADEIERLWAENEKLREQVNSGRSYREAQEGLPEGTLPRV